jgi:hypothetical protein
MALDQRFWSKVDIRGLNDCWEWQAHLGKGGYGSFWHERRNVGAHRLVVEKYIQPLLKNQVAMHKCDNPRCVNPLHLTYGTHKDNTQDMLVKGRGHIGKKIHPNGHMKGVTNPSVKLTQAQAIKIKYFWKSRARRCDVAKIYNVSPYTISKIWNNETWPHI